MTAPTPFGFDHSNGPNLSEMWDQAARESAAENGEPSGFTYAKGGNGRRDHHMDLTDAERDKLAEIERTELHPEES